MVYTSRMWPRTVGFKMTVYILYTCSTLRPIWCVSSVYIDSFKVAAATDSVVVLAVRPTIHTYTQTTRPDH